MNQLTDKTVSFSTASSAEGRGAYRDLTNFLVRALIKLGIRNEDFGYHLLRASMVIIFFFFGYQCKNRSKPAPDFGRKRQVISAESGR
jgi:hypothetical protein